MSAGARTRAAAATAVHAVVAGGRSLDAALPAAESGLPASEHALLRALTYDTLRRWWSLNARLETLLARPLKKRDRVVQALLATGLLQLARMRVPDHAAVGLTVEATRHLNRPRLAGLVNGVLRSAQRQSDASARAASTDGSAPQEARFDHPTWIIERLQRDWPDDWESILAASNARAPMWLRVNARRQTVESYLDSLEQPARHLAGLAQALCLESPVDVALLPGFESGAVSVQDGAAQLAAPWLLGDGGRRLLDLCAAPGGKTAHLLELAPADATLTAVDVAAERAARIEETLARLGLAATVLVADASEPGDWWDGEPFDRVLLDAPCSATGVMRRHPDVKHLRRPGDVAGLARLQAALLEAAWTVLAPGGRLLYVTCSVFADENDAVVSRFLEAHGDANEKHLLPNNNIEALMRRKSAGFQVLPGTADLDGFYFACLDKVS